MPEPNQLASQISIKLNGTELPADVQAKLMAVSVDQHAHLPAMFTIRLQDRGLILLDQGPLDLTGTVEISAERADGERFVLMEGEITALEPIFGEDMMAELVVRGYDKLHRLYRETSSRAYINIKDSDIARQVAERIGLQAEIETTATVYDHLYQSNLSDLEFLKTRAWRIGYECFIEGGKLFFRKPTSSAAQVTLTWGDDLISFRPSISLAEQVDEVIVKGWDVEKKEPIIGRASQGGLYPRTQDSKDGAGWAQTFGPGKKIIVDQPVVSQAEADLLAAARLDELSGAYIEAEGVAFRRPDIRAGQKVRLEGLGQRFSGEYLVTRAAHSHTSEGLRTVFQVCGARSGMLVEQLAGPPTAAVFNGAVIGVVTNSLDPNNWGRVKVKFPWMAEDAESGWARVIGIGAGPDAGLHILPEVGDEVLVLFEHGDISRPFIIGGLWNGKSGPPSEAVNARGGEPFRVKEWKTPEGHRIALYDNEDKGIEIVSADERSVTISDKDRKVTVKTKQVTITVEDDKLTIESSGDIRIQASANLKLEASGNVDIEAGGQVTVRGAVINLN